MNGFNHFSEQPQLGFQPHHLHHPNGMANGIHHHDAHRQPNSFNGHHPNGHHNGHVPFNHNGHPGSPQNFSPQPPFPQFSNAMMANMGNMNMGAFNPFLQLVQDTARLSVPVGTYPDDQALLVEALYQSTKNGTTYRQAIETLHERNNHSALLWKDYYLDHRLEIDALVAAKEPMTSKKSTEVKNPVFNVPVVRGARKPSLSELGPDSPERPPPPSVRPRPKPRRTVSQILVKTEPVESSLRLSPPGPKRRQTINSITAPTPVFNSKLPAPAAEIKVPEPPSRSPTPPTKVVPTVRGNKYTTEDRDYFIKYISWRLNADPHLTKVQLCEELADKVPHHTAASWGSHWQIRHELADKILARAKESIEVSDSSDEEEDDDENEDDKKGKFSSSTKKLGSFSSSSTLLRRPNYKESSSESEDESENSAGLTDADAHGSDDETISPRTKKRAMINRARPTAFVDEDFKAMANHIADTPNWDDLGALDRWKPFAEKYNKRSYKAWNEQYRRRKDELHRKAEKIKRKRATEKEVMPRIKQERNSASLHPSPPICPPSWTANSSYGPPAKRKFAVVGDPSASERMKRYKDVYAD